MGRNVLEITRKTKSQTKSEDRYWGVGVRVWRRKNNKKEKEKKTYG